MKTNNIDKEKCCFNCLRYDDDETHPCILDDITLKPLMWPDFTKEECENQIALKIPEMEINLDQYNNESKQELNYIETNKDNLDKMEQFEPHIEEIPSVEIINKTSEKKIPLSEYKKWRDKILKKFDSFKRTEIINEYFLHPDKNEESLKNGLKNVENDEKEKMLDGETEISHFEQITTWKRVLNAARRTIGKDYLDKEPSMSWKAKILLAEHSPIRLLEYDFGWKKIRQWVTAHFVRHHEGVEKFVHSQRGDRRKLPCDRDHIYQGAKNDMDMTCNAQSLINISRKRLCNCASKETRQAWNQVMDELEKVDPILRSKCVPECIYRGFCPEWMGSCGYYKTNNYKKQLAEYRRTKYDKERQFYIINKNNIHIIVENTGHIYEIPNDLLDTLKTGQLSVDLFNEIQFKEYIYTKHKWINGDELCIENPIIPICSLVYTCFSDDELEEISRNSGNIELIHKGEEIIHIDGNIYNNDIDNLIKKNVES